MVETRCATSKQNLWERICWKGKQRDSLVTDGKQMGFKGLGFVVCLVCFCFPGERLSACVSTRSTAKKVRGLTDVGERR